MKRTLGSVALQRALSCLALHRAIATADRQARTSEHALALWAAEEGISLTAATRSGHAKALELKRTEQRGRRARRARTRSLQTLVATPADTMVALRAKLAATLPLVEEELSHQLLCSLARDLRRLSRASACGG